MIPDILLPHRPPQNLQYYYYFGALIGLLSSPYIVPSLDGNTFDNFVEAFVSSWYVVGMPVGATFAVDVMYELDDERPHGHPLTLSFRERYNKTLMGLRDGLVIGTGSSFFYERLFSDDGGQRGV